MGTAHNRWQINCCCSLCFLLLTSSFTLWFWLAAGGSMWGGMTTGPTMVLFQNQVDASGFKPPAAFLEPCSLRCFFVRQPLHSGTAQKYWFRYFTVSLAQLSQTSVERNASELYDVLILWIICLYFCISVSLSLQNRAVTLINKVTLPCSNMCFKWKIFFFVSTDKKWLSLKSTDKESWRTAK